LAILCIAPFFLESAPVEFLPPYAELWQTVAACGGVLSVMLLVIGIRTWLDRATQRQAIILNLLFIALAIGLAATHREIVDDIPAKAQWQRDLYLKLFANDYDPPHQYRPLPYGFVRALERVTHDWSFSCLAYRWFFTYWFLWGWYRLARMVHDSSHALLTLAVIIPLYPLSIIHYWGQLADPLSHALMVLSMLFVLENRPVALAAALFLGVLAKETAVIIVPAYFAGHWRAGWKALATTAALSLVGIAAFLAARLPLGWPTGDRFINGAGLMIGTNLGIGKPIASTSVGLRESYLHPLVFVGIFLPFIAWNWRDSDRRLRLLFLIVTPLLLLSNIAFGWMYESRNYVPLLPLLTTLALPARPKPATATRSALADRS
jgi:hypothetical protein